MSCRWNEDETLHKGIILSCIDSALRKQNKPGVQSSPARVVTLPCLTNKLELANCLHSETRSLQLMQKTHRNVSNLHKDGDYICVFT